MLLRLKAPVAIFACALLSAGGAGAQYCGLEVPLLDTFDYEAWSGLYRYVLYQGTYPDAPANECQLEYWELVEGQGTTYNWNLTFRYPNSDTTDALGGTAVLEEGLGAGNFLTTTPDGAVEIHLMMLETDYETYAAYIECDERAGYNFPIIYSTSLDIDPELVARIVDQFQTLGANMDAFVQVTHDDACTYEF